MKEQWLHALGNSCIGTPGHPYNAQRSDSRLTYYVAGYAARKTQCDECKEQLVLTACEGEHLGAAGFTNSCNNGGQLYPSVKLFIFVSALEDSFTGCFSNTELHHDSIMDVLAIIDEKGMGSVGCDEVLTANLTGFYIVTRLHFYVKGLNKSCDIARRRAQQHLKLSHFEHLLDCIYQGATSVPVVLSASDALCHRNTLFSEYHVHFLSV